MMKGWILWMERFVRNANVLPLLLLSGFPVADVTLTLPCRYHCLDCTDKHTERGCPMYSTWRAKWRGVRTVHIQTD